MAHLTAWQAVGGETYLSHDNVLSWLLGRLGGSRSIVRLGSARFDDLLDLLFGEIPVVGGQLDQVDVEVLSDGCEGVVTFAVVDETDADADPAEPAASPADGADAPL